MGYETESLVPKINIVFGSKLGRGPRCKHLRGIMGSGKVSAGIFVCRN